ncbi:hypothetical protein ACQY0O_003798 [Thecaphora frezii]
MALRCPAAPVGGPSRSRDADLCRFGAGSTENAGGRCASPSRSERPQRLSQSSRPSRPPALVAESIPPPSSQSGGTPPSSIPKWCLKRMPSKRVTTSAATTVLISSVLIFHPAFVARASAVPPRSASPPSSGISSGDKGKQRQWPDSGEASIERPTGRRSLFTQNVLDAAGRTHPFPDPYVPVHIAAARDPSQKVLAGRFASDRGVSGAAALDPRSVGGPLDDVDDALPRGSSISGGHGSGRGRDMATESDFDAQLSLGSVKPLRVDRLVKRASGSQIFSLPSSYPSTIASSWSRPERSVWFQSKAIIITSIFLAIFIVLFIGAAVFLRDRKDDEFLEETDEAQFEWMRSERVQAGLAVDGSSGDKEKEISKRRKRSRVKNALGMGKSNKNKLEGQPRPSVDREPSTGSSSAVRRGSHLVSRWTRISAKKKSDSRETFVASDTVSFHSNRSHRRPALGRPSPPEQVEITYDDAPSGDTHLASQQQDAFPSDALGLGESAPSSPMSAKHRRGSDVQSLRPPPTPPPHDPSMPPSGAGEARHSGGSRGPTTSSCRALDRDDFDAADEAEAAAEEHRAQQLPPAYISSGTTGGTDPRTGGRFGGSSASTNLPSAAASALAQGDRKRGLPPPEERDSDIPAEVLAAVLHGIDEQEDAGCVANRATTSRDTVHVAVDDKETLGALFAAASMPGPTPGSAHAEEAMVPAYASSAVAAADSATFPSAPHMPSAPELAVDHDGFEVADEGGEPSDPGASESFVAPEGKGKGKVGTGKLPAPPRPVDTVFSPFDQPYRLTGAPNSSNASLSSPPGTPFRSRSRSSTSPNNSAGGLEGTAKGKQPIEGSSAHASDKQREAEAELAHYLASTPADLLHLEETSGGVVGAAPSRTAASAPAFESLPAYDRTNSSQPLLLPTAPAIDEFEATAFASSSGSSLLAPSSPWLNGDEQPHASPGLIDGTDTVPVAPCAPSVPFSPSAPELDERENS